MYIPSISKTVPIGQRFKMVRKSLGYTQMEFAEKLHVNTSTIHFIEKGERNPTLSLMVILCKEFNVNLNWLACEIGHIFNEER